MKRREIIFLFILVIILGLILYKENEIEEIRNRPFPMAGEEKFGNDAGMETGDDESVELLNREPIE